MFESIKSKWRARKQSSNTHPSRVATSHRSLMSWLENLGRADLSKTLAIIYYIKCYPVSSGVDKINGALTNLEPIITDVYGNPINFDPLSSMMHSQDSIMEMIKKMQLFWDTTGEVYLELSGINNLLSVKVLRSQFISTVQGNDDFPESFIFSNAGDQETYTIDKNGKYFNCNKTKELIYYFRFNPESSCRGLSPLSGISAQIEQFMSATNHNLAILTNSIKPSAVFTSKDAAKLPKQQIDQLKEHLDEFYSGAGNAGNYTVLGGDFEIEQMNQQSDMDFDKLDRETKNAVFDKLGIPLTMTDTSSATFNNKESDKLSFYDDTVIPTFKMMSKWLAISISERINTDFRIGYITSNIPALQERELNNIERRSKIGFMSDNELRALDGLEPYDGGDIVYKPTNLVPVGTDEDTNNEDNIKSFISDVQKVKSDS